MEEQNGFGLDAMGCLIFVRRRNSESRPILEDETRPWVVMGDLNEVIGCYEKFVGRPVENQRLFLKEFMQNVGAVDLGFSGNIFTWENKHDRGYLIKERLDRAVGNSSWVSLFGSTKVYTY